MCRVADGQFFLKEKVDGNSWKCVLGPGPTWVLGPLGPGPTWARAHLGPGPLGPRTHLGPGPLWPGPFPAPGPPHPLSWTVGKILARQGFDRPTQFCGSRADPLWAGICQTSSWKWDFRPAQFCGSRDPAVEGGFWWLSGGFWPGGDGSDPRNFAGVGIPLGPWALPQPPPHPHPLPNVKSNTQC
jgi:hypothetical protein